MAKKETNAETTQATTQAPAPTLDEQLAAAREEVAEAKATVGPAHSTAPSHRKDQMRTLVQAHLKVNALEQQQQAEALARQQADFDAETGNVINLAELHERIGKQLAEAQQARAYASMELARVKGWGTHLKVEEADLRRRLEQMDAPGQQHRPPARQGLASW